MRLCICLHLGLIRYDLYIRLGPKVANIADGDEALAEDFLRQLAVKRVLSHGTRIVGDQLLRQVMSKIHIALCDCFPILLSDFTHLYINIIK